MAITTPGETPGGTPAAGHSRRARSRPPGQPGRHRLAERHRGGRHWKLQADHLVPCRIASYWLPLLAGPPAYLLFRHCYGTPAVRPADQQGTDADPEHRPRGGNDS